MFSYAQELLIAYLKEIDTPTARGMYIVGILWDEEATDEMLCYIAETRETDHQKISDVAEEIAQRYKEK